MHLFSSIPPNKSPPKSLGFVLLLRLRLCFAPCFALLLCSFACGKQVILLGDGAVGKTSLATRFCEAKRPGGRAGGGQMVRGFLRKEASSTAPERLPLVSPLAIFANFLSQSRIGVVRGQWLRMHKLRLEACILNGVLHERLGGVKKPYGSSRGMVFIRLEHRFGPSVCPALGGPGPQAPFVPECRSFRKDLRCWMTWVLCIL